MTHEVKAVANPDPELGTSFLAAVAPIEGAREVDLLRMAASAHSFAPYGDEKGVLCFYTHDDTLLCYPHINPDTGKATRYTPITVKIPGHARKAQYMCDWLKRTNQRAPIRLEGTKLLHEKGRIRLTYFGTEGMLNDFPTYSRF